MNKVRVSVGMAVAAIILVSIPFVLKGYAVYELKRVIAGDKYPIIASKKLPEFINTSQSYKEISVFDLRGKIPVELTLLESPEADFPDMVSFFAPETEDINKNILFVRHSERNRLIEAFQGKISEQKFVELFGAENLDSEFQFRKTLYSIDPLQINYFSSQTELKLALLSSLMREADIGTPDKLYEFSFTQPELHGFQIGEPKDSRRVYVEVHGNRILYTIYFTGIEQREIDVLLSTLRLDG